MVIDGLHAKEYVVRPLWTAQVRGIQGFQRCRVDGLALEYRAWVPLHPRGQKSGLVPGIDVGRADDIGQLLRLADGGQCLPVVCVDRVVAEGEAYRTADLVSQVGRNPEKCCLECSNIADVEGGQKRERAYGYRRCVPCAHCAYHDQSYKTQGFQRDRRVKEIVPDKAFLEGKKQARGHDRDDSGAAQAAPACITMREQSEHGTTCQDVGENLNLWPACGHRVAITGNNLVLADNIGRYCGECLAGN